MAPGTRPSPAVYGGRQRPIETVEDRHAPPSTDRIRSDGARPRPGRRRQRRGQGRRRHRDARRAPAARPGGRLDDHDRLVARPAPGRRDDTPVLGRGRLPAVHATVRQPPSTLPDGRIARATSPPRSLCPQADLGDVAFGMRGDMCSRGTCVSSFEFFRVADTTAAEAAAAAAQARTEAGRAPAPGQRREAAVAPAPVAPLAPVADPAADPTTPTPPAPAPRTAPSVDGAWLAALMVIGLALTGIVIAARGRGRTSAA